MLYQFDKYDNFFFNLNNEYLTETEFQNFVKEFNFTIIKSNKKNFKVYEYFLTECINKQINYN